MTPARSFGRYRVTGTLGTGAMGEVYAAVDDALGREVAVKTLRGNASGLAARLLDERFRREARAIGALHHPGVVQVFDIDLTADPPYLVMERVAGPTLKERLAGGALTADALRALGVQIGRALAAAHAAGIVHRDVKPANILAAGADSWKLADFGVAHVPDSSLTMTGQFVGSPAYAPPEALVRGQSGPPGDVYGLGATLYEAAAGRWPRTEATSGALLAPLPALGELAPALPPEIAAVIDRAVAIEPDHRPSAAELADALAGATSHPGLAAAAPAAVPAAPPVTPPMASVTPATLVTPVAPAGAVRWKPWAVGAAVIFAIALIARTHGGSPPGGPIPPIGATVADPRPDPPTTIRVAPPAGMDGKQIRDWNKIIDELDKGHFEGARHKLDEFEDHHGETDETRDLRSQLDALGPDLERGPDDVRRPGGSHGRGKKHRDD